MQRKTFPGVVYLSNPDFCDFEVIFLLMSWNALVCHLPSISFKQHTVPASQQLEEWAMGTAGPSLLCTQVLVRHLYDHSLWQGERRVWVKEESCSIQEDLAFRKQCNSSCLVREQLHGPFQPHPGEESLVTPAGYKSDCQVYLRKSQHDLNEWHAFLKICQLECELLLQK